MCQTTKIALVELGRYTYANGKRLRGSLVGSGRRNEKSSTVIGMNRVINVQQTK